MPDQPEQVVDFQPFRQNKNADSAAGSRIECDERRTDRFSETVAVGRIDLEIKFAFSARLEYISPRNQKECFYG